MIVCNKDGAEIWGTMDEKKNRRWIKILRPSGRGEERSLSDVISVRF
jgi:hypothetical protein